MLLGIAEIALDRNRTTNSINSLANELRLRLQSARANESVLNRCFILHVDEPITLALGAVTLSRLRRSPLPAGACARTCAPVPGLPLKNKPSHTTQFVLSVK